MNYERWQRLMIAFQLDFNEATYQALINAYSEKHRFYHTADHITATLKHFDNIIGIATYPNEIELSLWFHDSIYKTFSSTNELDSADWAVKFSTQNKLPTAEISRIHSLIMATRHTALPKTKDESIIVDIDLTILGTNEHIYKTFEQSVRKEYKLVPYFIYKKKRKEILTGFLSKERIYQNQYFFNRFEHQARLNIKNAISIL